MKYVIPAGLVGLITDTSIERGHVVLYWKGAEVWRGHFDEMPIGKGYDAVAAGKHEMAVIVEHLTEIGFSPRLLQ